MAFLHVLTIVVQANSETIICLGEDDDCCYCTIVTSSLNSSTITQDNTVLMLMEDIVINESIQVNNKVNLAIISEIEL